MSDPAEMKHKFLDGNAEIQLKKKRETSIFVWSSINLTLLWSRNAWFIFLWSKLWLLSTSLPLTQKTWMDLAVGFSEVCLGMMRPQCFNIQQKACHFFYWKVILTNKCILGREPWSSGYGRRLMFQRLWVRIPAPFTGWTFFHIHICCENCNVCLEGRK